MENEMQEQKGVETASTSQEENSKVEEKPTENITPNDKPETFTQSQVNDIVVSRLEKDRASMYKRYGVKDKDEFEALFGKAKGYDELKTNYDKLLEERNMLSDKMAFMKNNVSPAKEVEIKALFKGLEMEFNEENLLKMLETHPEWLNAKVVDDTPKTTFKQIGIEHANITKEESDIEKRRRLFGD